MDSLKNYMKVGIIQSMAFPYSSKTSEGILKSILTIAKDSFFDVIEIGHFKDDVLRDKIKNIIEVSKLISIYSGHSTLLSNGLNINNLNHEDRLEAVEVLKKGIDEAYFMKSKSFSFFSGRYEEETKEESLKALISSTKDLCDYAKEKGDMDVLLEVFDYNIDKRSLLGPVELVKRFAEEMEAYSNFGIMIDLSHLPLLGETPEQAILPIKKYIKHIHIGNAVVKEKNLEAYGDEHPRFGFHHSENDTNELAQFLKVLIEIGYFDNSNRPIISFEVKPRLYEDERLVISNSKRVLKEAWGKVI